MKTRTEREFKKDIMNGFKYTVAGAGPSSVPIVKSTGNFEPHPIIIPIPIPLLKIANKSTLEDGVRAGKEALDQRQRTESRISQLGFTVGKGSAESYSQYQWTESNDSRKNDNDEIHNMSLIGFSMDRASRIIAKRYFSLDTLILTPNPWDNSQHSININFTLKTVSHVLMVYMSY